jgi:hypothetical protein
MEALETLDEGKANELAAATIAHFAIATAAIPQNETARVARAES